MLIVSKFVLKIISSFILFQAALLKLRAGSDYATTTDISLDDITTPDAVHIRIGTGHTTTSNIGTEGYTTANNIVYINVQDSDLNTDAALYGKIRDAIHNHGDIDMNATLGTGADDNKINLVSTALGAGNTMFYDESSTQVERNPDNGDESGAGGGGASDGHTLTLGSKSIILDDDGSSNAGNNVYVQMVDGNDASFWANLENAINSNTDFTVDNTAALSGGRRTFNLRSDVTGSAQDSLTVSTSDASFNVTLTPAAANTGTNESGANDYDETNDQILIGVYDTNSSGVTHNYRIRCDKDNSHSTSNSDGYSKSTDSSGAIPVTTIYVDSTQTNTNFWNSIEAALDSCGLPTTQTAGTTPRVFSVTSSVAGARGNSAGTPGNTSGATFQYNSGYLDTRFKNGADASGAAAGDTITIHGETITITHGAQDLSNRIVDSSGPTDSQFWEALRTCINANVANVVAATASSGNPRTFTVTTTATGSSANPAISAESGDTFVITAAGSNGTNEAGAEAGDTITIGGATFEMYTGASDSSAGSNVGVAAGNGISNDDFHDNLKAAIIANTDFDTITTSSIDSNGYRQFNLTHNDTGTVNNVAFTTNSSGIRDTFNDVNGASGGTDTFGLQHLDKIIFSASSDGAGGVVGNAPANQITFAIDTGNATNQPAPHANTPVYNIGIADLITPGSNDNTRSTTAWNRIKDEIILRTNFDTINIQTFFDTSDGENHAIFHITSSETGSAYNTEIVQTVTSSNDGKDGFTLVAQTAGGTDESGATAGDTLQIGNSVGTKTYTIRNNSSLAAGGLEINAGTTSTPLTDTQFFDNVTASIKAQQDYDIITYTESSDTGSFQFTASNGAADPFMAGCADISGQPANCQLHLTGVLYNGNMAETGDSFSNLEGIAGGQDGIFNVVRHQEIIPQPRYNYPHAIVSPGSLRCPTDKSNLGLIPDHQDGAGELYKLRSNHFQLTRSLGFPTDGLYDNTSRWTTPDLTGLKPFDDNYDEYYERIRGLNHHYALVPEFRMSSHVEDILKSGNDESEYFANNYWLELTGSSFDDGVKVATNEDDLTSIGSLRRFNSEFTVTSKIRYMEQFIEDNVDAMDLIPFSLTLTCDAIKSFLPYEGFYPQTRTVQMCEAFAGSYAKGIQAIEADEDDTTLDFPDNNVLAQSRPVFDVMMSPGLLYNTIKSGIAVDYPIVETKMATASIKDPYGGTNYMVTNEYFEDRAPFETLLNPQKYIAKKWIVDLNPHPSSSLNLKARIGAVENQNYSMMANNFFAESMEFFLEKGQPSRIKSKPESDPNFGVVVAIDEKDNILPIYKSIFRCFKSSKQHPYLEASGASQVVSMSIDESGTFDRLYNRPPSGTNYFEAEYCGTSGADLEYELEIVDYPRPNLNPFAEVGTITMYSQPNAFGPPCAGGVSVKFAGISDSDDITALTSDDNNTTYMMYDSTNGYNAPFTPPYYDGEAWAIYTFTPPRSGKFGLDEILANTTVEFLRYEVNHESGSFGDRGTFGPQGFTLNDNAMQVDASFNLFKKAIVLPGSEGNEGLAFSGPGVSQPMSRGNVWIIESKYETPILNFAKYLNRAYNAEFEAGVTTADIYTSQLSLSGTRAEQDTLSGMNPSMASVHQLSGVLNPIGMWHQFGDVPSNADGIYMQMTDVPKDYLLRGTEMTIPNPKYTTVVPEDASCDGAGASSVYNKKENLRANLRPYVNRQLNKRRLVGNGEFSVEGGAIQVLDADTDVILDTELREIELQDLFGVTLGTTTYHDNFKFFHVFKNTSTLTKAALTVHKDFVGDGGTGGTTPKLKVFIDNTDTSGLSSGFYTATTTATNHPFKGNWATSYYNIDRASSYAPLMIVTKNLKALSYDFGEYSAGPWEEFLKDFSIGIPYSKQSLRFEDAEPVDCVPSTVQQGGGRDAVFAPTYVAKFIDARNSTLSAGSLSKITIAEGGLLNILETPTMGSVSTPVATIITPESKLVNSAIQKAKQSKTGFKAIQSARVFRLIPPDPTPQHNPAQGLSTGQIGALSVGAALGGALAYSFPEPQFVRGSIRFNAGNAPQANTAALITRDVIKTMPQYAPQNDANITGNAATIRWGQFMPKYTNAPHIKSLADLVGFETEPVKMGRTAKQKIISEAIVAIPYLTDGTGFCKLDDFAVNKYLFQQGLISEDRTALPEGAAISQEQLDARIGEIELDQAVLNQIEQMQRYIFPPHIDFINYNVTPVPMYIFEYTMRLDRNDLVSIWQGVATEKMKKVEFSEKSITHVLDENSMLRTIKRQTDNMSLMKDLKWRIFKVKQKASNNYDLKMAKDLVDAGFIPELDEGVTFNPTTIGYNWPYDFCSIVENAQIKVDIQLRKPLEMNVVVPDSGAASEDEYTGIGDVSILDEPVLMEDITTDTAGSAANPEMADGDVVAAVDVSLGRGLIEIVTGTGDGDSSCVLAGTMIETERGTVPVEEINFDDKVKSYDFDRDGGAVFDYYDVMSIMRPVIKSKWAHVITSLGHELKCTEDHPLFTLSRGSNELPINECEVGTKIWVVQGDEMIRDTIQSIEYFEEDVLVYNFEVRDVHSYLSNGILSHNKSVDSGGGGRAPRETITYSDRDIGTETKVEDGTQTGTSPGSGIDTGGNSY